MKNHQGDHIYKQIENLHTVCVETAKKHQGQCPITFVRAMIFYDVKFDHVTSRDTTLFMES